MSQRNLDAYSSILICKKGWWVKLKKFYFNFIDFFFFQADTIPTQGVFQCNIFNSQATEEDQDPNIWGRLLSINKLFPSVNLLENEYSLGRGKKCDIALDSKDIQASKYYLAYSSTHFKIIRDPIKNYVYIQDLSSNGTYVNGEKIGKNKRHVLDNNAEIALASKAHRVYVYVDANASEDSSIPANVREKYIISKEIGRGAYGEVKLCFIRGR
jgi:serine/threonine-protein kinase Chk2